MAVSRVASSSGAASGTGTFSLNFPAGYTPTAGELCVIWEEGGTTAPTVPTGFTREGFADVGSAGTDISATRLDIYRKILTGSETSPLSINTGFGHGMAAMAIYTGHDPTTPLTLSTAKNQTPAATASSTNTIASAAGDGNGMFIAAYAHDRDSVTASAVTSPDFANLAGEASATLTAVSINTAGGGGLVVVEGDPAADSSGAVSHSVTITSSIWASLLIRVNPAAVAAVLTATAGSYTLTGTASGLAAQRKITAASGSYTLTGTAAALKAGRQITATAGSYTLTGAAAGLAAQRKLVAASGSYTLTGTAATLAAQRALIAAAGSYALTGGDVALTYTPAATGLSLDAENGAYVLTGADVTFTYSPIADSWFVRDIAPSAIVLAGASEPGAVTFVMDTPPPAIELES